MTLMTAIDSNASVRNLVEPHAASIESCASAMEAAGIGGGPHDGHVAVLRDMAGCMRAEAARGTMPSAYDELRPPFTAGKLSSISIGGNMKMNESSVPNHIKAALDGPSCRPNMALLRRAGLDRITHILSSADLNARMAEKGLSVAERIQIKIALDRSGLMIK